MKRLVLFSIIFFVAIISANPLLYFINPTPANNYETTPTANFEINISVSNISNYSEIIFQWGGVNYSLYDDSTILMLNLNNNSDLGENDSLVVDISNYSNNGTITSATFNSSGKYGGAYNFDAENEYINLSDNERFRGENFSISMWVNIEDMSVKQVSASGYTTCILLNRGDVYCLGRNDFGQLGVNSTTDNSLPQLVLGGYNFSELDNAGYPDSDYMCGILINGSAMCWGLGTNGQLGNNASANSLFPVVVNGSYNFTEISTGRYHTCGLLINNTALCWGRNDKGQIGDNTTTSYNIPHWILGGYNFSKISAGDDETCGILTNGTAMCWGRSDYGSLGDGTTVEKHIPTNVSGDYNFTYITAGNQVVCGILVNGSAVCWGGNAIGSFLGHGLDASSSVPVFVSGNYTFSYLEQSYGGVCGVLTNGSAVCWGYNVRGAVGDGTRVNRLSPVSIFGNFNFSGISEGYYHICGRLIDGKVTCWGLNDYNQLGKNNIASMISLPVLFSQGNISSNSYSFLSGGFADACGLKNGSIYCWGVNNLGSLGDNTTETREVPLEVYGSYTFNFLSAGHAHNCGILVNGSAMCWGVNTVGQLGDNSTSQRNIPTLVYGNYNFSSLASGVSHTCGLLINGSAICWGLGTSGQLGNNASVTSLFPVAVNGDYNFSRLKLGVSHTCGLLINGSAMCWGSNQYGQLGNGSIGGSSAIPIPVSGNYNFSNLSDFSNNHNCGLLINGSARCWGYNDYGQLGNGSIGGSSAIPIPVSGNYNFSNVFSVRFSSYGILTNGTLLSWGRNNYGQLGDGTTTDSSIPIEVKVDEVISSILPGRDYTFGVLEDGRIVSWGNNHVNQQLFHSFDETAPSSGIYKGNVFGKNTSSYRIGSTFEGDLRFYTGYGFEDIDLSSGWNHIVLTYDGTTAKTYLNGDLNVSFEPPVFSWYNDTTNLLIGEDTRGSIDEVIMWNRTLSASEIEQVYDSNIKKINSTDFEFYSSKSSLSEGTYTYGLLFTDLSSNVFSSGLRNFIVRSSSSAVDSGVNTGSSKEIIYKPTREQAIAGYSKLLTEGNKVEIGEDIVEIIGVDYDNSRVSFSFNGEVYNLNNEESVKIDSDSDGYYDLEISVSDIRFNGYANFLFKEIYEEIPSDIQEGTDEGIGGIVNEENSIWVYVLSGIVIIGVAVYFLAKRNGKKRRRKKYGY